MLFTVRLDANNNEDTQKLRAAWQVQDKYCVHRLLIN